MKSDPTAKSYDLLAATPLMFWYGYSAWVTWPALASQWALVRYGYADARVYADLLGRGASFLFSAFLIILLAARRPPLARTTGTLPRVAAVVGTFAAVGFLYLPKADLPLPWTLTAAALVFLGLVLALSALAYLGRAFSIMPEARILVTGGPYRMVRHPVYLFEEIAMIGVAMQYALPWSALLWLVHLGIQLVRIRYEENVLAAAFPTYTGYAAHTRRLIPGLY